MAPKPSEIKKLIALLDSEAEDVESLAKEVFNLVEQLLTERQRYVVFTVHPSLKIIQAVGPYPSVDKAMKDYPKRTAAYDSLSRCHLALLRSPESIMID